VRRLLRRVVVVVDGSIEQANAVSDRLVRFGVTAADVDHDQNIRTNKTRLTADVHFPSRDALAALLTELGHAPGVRHIKVQRPG
jgi:hypothetical protein